MMMARILILAFLACACGKSDGFNVRPQLARMMEPVRLERGGLVKVNSILLDREQRCLIVGQEWEQAVVPNHTSVWTHDDRDAMEYELAVSSVVGYLRIVKEFDPSESETGGRYTITRTLAINPRYANFSPCPSIH